MLILQKTRVVAGSNIYHVFSYLDNCSDIPQAITQAVWRAVVDEVYAAFLQTAEAASR